MAGAPVEIAPAKTRQRVCQGADGCTGLGFTLGQTYRFVLLPVALRVVLPTLTSEAMNLIKNSSVAYAIGVTELIYFSTQAGEETSMHGTMYLGATILYAISAFAINRLAAGVDKRTRLPGMLGGAK